MYIKKDYLTNIENYYRKQDDFGRRVCINFIKHLMISFSKKDKKGKIVVLDKLSEQAYGNIATMFSLDKIITSERTEKDSHFQVQDEEYNWMEYSGKEYFVEYKITDGGKVINILKRFPSFLNNNGLDNIEREIFVGDINNQICIRQLKGGLEIDRHTDDMKIKTESFTEGKVIKLFNILTNLTGHHIKTSEIRKRRDFHSNSVLQKNLTSLRRFLGEEKGKESKFLITGEEEGITTYRLSNLRIIDYTE